MFFTTCQYPQYYGYFPFSRNYSCWYLSFWMA